MIQHILSEKLGSSQEFAQYTRWPKGTRKAVRGWTLGTTKEESPRESTSHTVWVLVADGRTTVLDDQSDTLMSPGIKPHEVAVGNAQWVDDRLAQLAPYVVREFAK